MTRRKTLTETQVRQRLAVAVAKAGGVNAFAEQVGLSGALVSYVLSGQRGVGPTLAAAIGLRRIVRRTQRTFEAIV